MKISINGKTWKHLKNTKINSLNLFQDDFDMFVDVNNIKIILNKKIFTGIDFKNSNLNIRINCCVENKYKTNDDIQVLDNKNYYRIEIKEN